MPESTAEEARLEEIMAGFDGALALIRRSGATPARNTPVQRISQALLPTFDARRKDLRSLFGLHVRLEEWLSFAGTAAGMFGIVAIFAPWISTPGNPVFKAMGGSPPLLIAIGIPLVIAFAVCLLFSRRSRRRQKELIEEARRLHHVHLELANAIQGGDETILERAILNVAAVANSVSAEESPAKAALTSAV
jgi:hypothetical protein